MKRAALAISFLLFYVLSFSQAINFDGLRKDYALVHKDSASCAKIYKKMIRSAAADPLTTAYRGAVTAAMADHATNKQEKIKLFTDGKKMLERSIEADSSNIETRFLRFSIQTNCPKALGYNKQIKADKLFILKNYSSITNAALKDLLKTFLMQSAYLTAAEKQKLKN